MAKPTLALIPASQGSKVFSVLPSSGVGDFDFSRGSAATRINSQGLNRSCCKWSIKIRLSFN